METPLDYASRICFSTEETLYRTYELALSQRNIDGDYVECGVAAGAQIIAMLHAVGASKVIHAFDSFQGIPLPCNQDDQIPGIRKLTPEEIQQLPDAGKQKLESSGVTVVSVDEFLVHLSGAGVASKMNLIIYEGWFEETMQVANIEKISLLRLDGDLYNSTITCLKYLFPKVVDGGVVIIDDWQLSGSRKACDDYFRSINYSPQYDIIHGIAYFTK